MKTLSWRKDLKLNAARCFSGTHATREIYQRSSRDKRFPREACFDLGDVKVVKEGGPLFERGMVFLRDTCHCVFFFHRNILDKRLPREGCSDHGDVKEEKAVVTFSEEQDEDTLVAEGHQIGRGTVFLRDTCQREIHQRNIC